MKTILQTSTTPVQTSTTPVQTNTTPAQAIQSPCKARIEEESVFINVRLNTEISKNLEDKTNNDTMQKFIKPDNDISRTQ